MGKKKNWQAADHARHFKEHFSASPEVLVSSLLEHYEILLAMCGTWRTGDPLQAGTLSGLHAGHGADRADRHPRRHVQLPLPLPLHRGVSQPGAECRSMPVRHPFIRLLLDEVTSALDEKCELCR